MKLQFDFFCRDIEAQLAFYRELLGLPEAVYTRSPVYRSVHTVDFQLGFHAASAGGLSGRRPAAGFCGYPTLMLEAPAAVDAMAARAPALGGRVLQAPGATPDGQWQAVLADPEDHVFRLACDDLPAGVQAAVPPN